MHARSLLVRSAWLLTALACAPDTQAPTESTAPQAVAVGSVYTVVDLGTLCGPHAGQPHVCGPYSTASSINARGQVVGTSELPSFFSPHAVLWDHGVITDLGTLFEPSAAISSYAYGINAVGQIVGVSTRAAGARAFLWDKGVMTDLGTLGGGDYYPHESDARGINAAGQVVGSSRIATLETHAFLWHKGAMLDLGTLGGYHSHANGINEAGQVVGSSTVAKAGAPWDHLSDFHAFLLEKGVWTDLGTLGGRNSYARGINPTGQVVGDSETATGQTHAFLWSRGVMLDLGTLGGDYSIAHGINAAGQVVGESRTGTGEAHAFLWEEGRMTDLGTLGGNSSAAYAINAAGQIVGRSSTGTDIFSHAVLWEKR
jgi:probable HAF family extracellular repeat protein